MRRGRPDLIGGPQGGASRRYDERTEAAVAKRWLLLKVLGYRSADGIVDKVAAEFNLAAETVRYILGRAGFGEVRRR